MNNFTMQKFSTLVKILQTYTITKIVTEYFVKFVN